MSVVDELTKRKFDLFMEIDGNESLRIYSDDLYFNEKDQVIYRYEYNGVININQEQIEIRNANYILIEKFMSVKDLMNWLNIQTDYDVGKNNISICNHYRMKSDGNYYKLNEQIKSFTYP